MYSFRMSFCTVPRELAACPRPASCATAMYSASRIAAVALIVIEVETFVQVDSVEQPLHVFDANRSPRRLCRLRPAQADGPSPDPICVGRSNATLRARRALAQQIFVALVRLLGVAHAGVLPHRPQPAAIHGRLHAAGVRKLSGLAQLRRVVEAFHLSRTVNQFYGNVGSCACVRNCGFLFGGCFLRRYVGHERPSLISKIRQTSVTLPARAPRERLFRGWRGRWLHPARPPERTHAKPGKEQCEHARYIHPAHLRLSGQVFLVFPPARAPTNRGKYQEEKTRSLPATKYGSLCGPTSPLPTALTPLPSVLCCGLSDSARTAPPTPVPPPICPAALDLGRFSRASLKP